MSTIICGPRADCADQNTNRWHCMRGHDGAPDGVCPLPKCDRRGANRSALPVGDVPPRED